MLHRVLQRLLQDAIQAHRHVLWQTGHGGLWLKTDLHSGSLGYLGTYRPHRGLQAHVAQLWRVETMQQTLHITRERREISIALPISTPSSGT